jgi:hypothetical protein
MLEFRHDGLQRFWGTHVPDAVIHMGGYKGDRNLEAPARRFANSLHVFFRERFLQPVIVLCDDPWKL